jgi:hypothetical protein
MSKDVSSTEIGDAYGVAESVEDYRRICQELRGEIGHLRALEQEHRLHIRELDETVEQLVDIVIQREAACYALKALVESMVREIDACPDTGCHESVHPHHRSAAYQNRYAEELKRLRQKYGKE